VGALSTPKRAKLVIGAIWIAGLAVGSYPMWTVGVIENKHGAPKCFILNVRAYRNWSSAILRAGTLIIPSIIIVVATVAIVVLLARSAGRRRSLFGNFALLPLKVGGL